jgi:hypothetical protein
MYRTASGEASARKQKRWRSTAAIQRWVVVVEEGEVAVVLFTSSTLLQQVLLWGFKESDGHSLYLLPPWWGRWQQQPQAEWCPKN